MFRLIYVVVSPLILVNTEQILQIHGLPITKASVSLDFDLVAFFTLTFSAGTTVLAFVSDEAVRFVLLPLSLFGNTIAAVCETLDEDMSMRATIGRKVEKMDGLYNKTCRPLH